MLFWVAIILISAASGVICGLKIRGRLALLWGAVIPLLLLSIWILSNEFLMPYQGGGASMWPIALVVAGTPATLIGGLAALATRWAKTGEI